MGYRAVSISKKALNIHLTSNPQRVTLQESSPGHAVNCFLKWFNVTPSGGVASPYYQISFGSALHNELGRGFGVRADCIQAAPSMAAALNIPVRFLNDQVPQNMNITIYLPGETGQPFTYDANGAQLFFEYDFIPS